VAAVDQHAADLLGPELIPVNQAGHLDWLHDKMYSYVYMKASLYREVLKRGRTDLASAISKRNLSLAKIQNVFEMNSMRTVL
jgi:hypothetical protein